MLTSTLNKNNFTLENLLSNIQIYLQRFKQNSLFKKIVNFKSLSQKQQDIFLSWKERFAIEFQTIIYTRYATTSDEMYKKMSLAHLQEEVGHDEMLSAHLRPEHTVMRDPIVGAILTWFIHKMIVLDNIEKMALMHLVLETSANFFYPWAYQNNVFSEHSIEPYIKLHAEADEKHGTIDVALLKNHAPHTYQRLHEVVTEGWDMMEHMLQRVLFLINEAES